MQWLEAVALLRHNLFLCLSIGVKLPLPSVLGNIAYAGAPETHHLAHVMWQEPIVWILEDSHCLVQRR
jgi:hypothetical protein